MKRGQPLPCSRLEACGRFLFCGFCLLVSVFGGMVAAYTPSCRLPAVLPGSDTVVYTVVYSARSAGSDRSLSWDGLGRLLQACRVTQFTIILLSGAFLKNEEYMLKISCSSQY